MLDAHTSTADIAFPTYYDEFCEAFDYCSTARDYNNVNNYGNKNNYDVNNNVYYSFTSSSRFLQEIDGANADDATWILTSSFVILTMQTGFALLETGASRPGFEVNILMKNVVDVLFGALSYFLIGYAFSFGSPSTPFIGLGDFAPHSYLSSGVQSGALFSRYIFQLSFAATSTTIVSGCVAMRMKFFIYCAYAFYAVIPYSVCAHWFFADNGWLATMGAQDFAGGSCVHLFGAMNGLVAICMLGPRKGRFDSSRPKSDFEGISPTDSLFGLFMLWWGWIGFNCGSSFGITDNKWIVATRAAITTINASSAGGIAGIFFSILKTRGKHVEVEDVVNAILGGLVAITPTCASVRSYDSFIVGSIGGVMALLVNEWVFEILKLDDPVGAIGVHAGAAIWGLLSDGLFSDATLPAMEDNLNGLFKGGGFQLLGYQFIAILSVIAWSLVTSTPFFYFVGVFCNNFDWTNPRKGLRVPPKEEMLGADFYLHGLGELEQVAPVEEGQPQGQEQANNNNNNNDNNNNNSINRIGRSSAVAYRPPPQRALVMNLRQTAKNESQSSISIVHDEENVDSINNNNQRSVSNDRGTTTTTTTTNQNKSELATLLANELSTEQITAMLAAIQRDKEQQRNHRQSSASPQQRQQLMVRHRSFMGSRRTIMTTSLPNTNNNNDNIDSDD